MASDLDKFDDFQKKAVKSAVNTVVSAGAGSGKTSVLAGRFADLVIYRNCNVDEILTLTFTKKATVEMSSRIYRTLKEKVPEKAKDFYKANIKTLDSYCAGVARLGSRYFGITPEFTQDENALVLALREKALPFILENRENPAIKLLVKTSDYQKAADELFINTVLNSTTIVSPLDFEAALELQRKTIVKRWADILGKIERSMSDIEDQILAIDSNAKSMADFTEKFYRTDEINPVLMEKDDILSGNYRKFLGYAIAHIDFAKSRKPSVKGSEQLKEIIDFFRLECDEMIPIIDFVYSYSAFSELAKLLNEFQEITNDFKRQSGILTFADTAALAVKTLLEYPEIRRIEKEKFKAIMIDEFQDNNILQKNLLFLLSEKPDRMEKSIPAADELCPDKLFFVGDEKQSIYKFRGADVSVFRELSDEFYEGNLSMDTNYRSHPALIRSFNRIFGGFPYSPGENTLLSDGKKIERFDAVFSFKTKINIPPNFEAIYQKVRIPEETRQKLSAGEIESPFAPRIFVANYNDENDEENDSGNESAASAEYLTNEEAEARWVALKIKELTESSDGKPPLYKAEDIAILFRKYSLQPLYERTLLQAGIPYDTEIVTGFFSDGVVNDLISFMRICVFESDKISYAQVLRSSFMNFSMNEMEFLVENDEKPFAGENLSGLSEKSKEIYLKTKEFYEKFKEEINSKPITKVISELWYDYGYRYETLWNRKVTMYAKLYDMLFEAARQAELENMSISAFLDYMEQYQNPAMHLENMDIPLENTSGVHILSIHKSKGLQYKVVFICGTHQGSKKNNQTSLVFTDSEYGFSVNTPHCPELKNRAKNAKSNFFYQLKKLEEDKKNFAELKRLTYVALTRAIDAIYITSAKPLALMEFSDVAEKFKIEGDENVFDEFGEFTLTKKSEFKKNFDSIAGILTPVFSFYHDERYAPFSPFVFEEIPHYERNSVYAESHTDEKNAAVRNTYQGKLEFLERFEKENTFEDVKILKTEKIPSKYLFPSKLYPEENIKNNEESVPDFSNSKELESVSSEINSIILSTANKISSENDDDAKEENSTLRFSFADFGTVAHFYMENIFEEENFSVPEKYFYGFDGNKEKTEKLKSLCKILQTEFKNSPLGKEALSSVWHRSEYSFKSRIKDRIVKGTMDLVFKDKNGKFTIIDFKTNLTVVPEIYYTQLSCYRKALSQMEGIKNENEIRCVLFYLRFAKEVDISEECTTVPLEEIAEKSL